MPSPPSPRSPLGTKKSEKIKKILKKVDRPSLSPNPVALSSASLVRREPSGHGPRPIDPILEVSGPAPGTVRLPRDHEPPPEAPTFGLMTADEAARSLAATVEPDISPLEFLLAVVRKAPPAGLSPEQVLFWEAKRLEAAKAAAPYVHGKQSVSDSSPVGKTHEEQLEELAD